jgi:hypothetical protein
MTSPPSTEHHCPTRGQAFLCIEIPKAGLSEFQLTLPARTACSLSKKQGIYESLPD